MLVACVGGVEIGIGEPILESESLAGQLELLGTALQDDIDVCVGVCLPALALVSPSEHAGALLVAATGHEVAELLVGILRELGEVSDSVEGELVAGLDTAQVEARVVHRLIYIASLAGLLALYEGGRELAASIDAYRRLRDSSPSTSVPPSEPSAPLLVREDGRPLYRKMVYNIVHARLTEGGAHAERLSPHVMRHSCATDMLNAGAPIASVQQMLGHASLVSTQVYTHVTYKDLKNNYQLAHPRAQKKGGQYGH